MRPISMPLMFRFHCCRHTGHSSAPFGQNKVLVGHSQRLTSRLASPAKPHHTSPYQTHWSSSAGCANRHRDVPACRCQGEERRGLGSIGHDTSSSDTRTGWQGWWCRFRPRARLCTCLPTRASRPQLTPAPPERAVAPSTFGGGEESEGRGARFVCGGGGFLMLKSGTIPAVHKKFFLIFRDFFRPRMNE